MYEECATGPLSDLAQRYAGAPPKGEIVIVIGPPGDPLLARGRLTRREFDQLRKLRNRDPSAANADLAAIHPRMPVVVRPEDFDRWLDCRGNEPRDVAHLMRPCEPGFFEAVPVSNRVNRIANVGQENIEPVELDPQAPQQRPAGEQLALF